MTSAIPEPAVNVPKARNERRDSQPTDDQAIDRTDHRAGEDAARNREPQSFRVTDHDTRARHSAHRDDAAH